MTTKLLSLTGLIAVTLLSGCGHDVVYTQVVTTEALAQQRIQQNTQPQNAQSQTIQPQNGQRTKDSKPQAKLQPPPAEPRPPFALQDYQTGRTIPTEQMRAVLPPSEQDKQAAAIQQYNLYLQYEQEQKQKRLMVVPVAMLNNQGMLVQAQKNAPPVHMVRIPMLAMPIPLAQQRLVAIEQVEAPVDPLEALSQNY